MVTPLPKPTKRDRPHGRIRWSELAIPKREPLRDDEYRKWVRGHDCLLPNFEQACGWKPDREHIEAAHLEHGGRGMKGSDASCIPLCPVHHDMLDAETLPWQIVAFLWMKCWQLREQWRANELASNR